MTRTRNITIGHTYEFTAVVTEAMKASLHGVPVHDLYGTTAMIAHMEWAARQHILDSLEPGEEGVGYAIHVTHLNPTPIGATVRVRSEVTGVVTEPSGVVKVTSRVAAWIVYDSSLARE